MMKPHYKTVYRLPLYLFPHLRILGSLKTLHILLFINWDETPASGYLIPKVKAKFVN